MSHAYFLHRLRISPKPSVFHRYLASAYIWRLSARPVIDYLTAPKIISLGTHACFHSPRGRSHPTVVSSDEAAGPQRRRLLDLPQSCPGCGALSQDGHPDQAGYYSINRKAVKHHLRGIENAKATLSSDTRSDLPPKSTKIEPSLGGVRGAESPETSGAEDDSANLSALMAFSAQSPPLCDRCHNLIFQSHGLPIAHPTIGSIAETIALSPYRKNHVYHVIDAADFPMSVIPRIFRHLSLVRLRSKNRRAKNPRFKSRQDDATVSFIITRSDLLAPQKEQVDRMMPYFIDVLRDTLGRLGESARLGNVHLVSAKRGWWTVQVKEELRKRGGANWMVGKVNVGKSNLLEVLLPKGMSGHSASTMGDFVEDGRDEEIQEMVRTTNSPSLLPPSQPFSPTPTLPLVSSLPGTTASPIRLPFLTSENISQSRRGELIDLPGLERCALSTHVSSDHQKSLVMHSRPTPSQHVIKNGQSLLLGGGLVRITPLGEENAFDALGAIPSGNPGSNIIAHPFLPSAVGVHITGTDKAEKAQLQERPIDNVETMLTSEGAGSVRSAGIFELDTDLTKRNVGSMLRAGVKLEDLYFKTFATDILIEGVGWVELVASVRRKKPQETDASDLTEDASEGSLSPEWSTPKVEVFSPDGKFVAQRRSLGVWSMLEADVPKRIRDRRKRARIIQHEKFMKKRTQKT